MLLSVVANRLGMALLTLAGVAVIVFVAAARRARRPGRDDDLAGRGSCRHCGAESALRTRFRRCRSSS